MVDVSSEPAEEAPKKEETKDESALPAEQPVETKVEEAKPEEVAAAPTAAEAELEKKVEEVAMVSATAAPKTTTTPVEAKKSSLLISLSICPVSINPNILQSQRNDHIGCPKVAGTFPSTKKWLYQANPYPINGTNKITHQLKTKP